MRIKVYFGKVCAKHPELKGERWLSGKGCVGCAYETRHRWFQENEKRRSTYFRKYREENREVRSAYCRKYREENREASLAARRKWCEENREARLAYARKYDAAFKAKHGVHPTTYYRRLKKERELECAI